MTKYNHLVKEQRNNIEYLISLNKNFTYISKAINVDRTTISKKIKRNRYIKSNFYDNFDKQGINSTIEKCDKLKHPKMNICEMDTVEGNKGGKIFLTILIKDTKFMFIRLLDKKNASCVNKEINKLKDALVIKLFSKIFRIVLADNESEFFDPIHIERNHEYIRRIFPKAYCLNNLTDKQIQRLETTINNIPRDKFISIMCGN